MSMDPYDMPAEIERLRVELGRAYRALWAFASALRSNEMLNDAAVGYHQITIAAAKRYVYERSLEGTDYFEGKPVELLETVLGDDY